MTTKQAIEQVLRGKRKMRVPARCSAVPSNRPDDVWPGGSIVSGQPVCPS